MANHLTPIVQQYIRPGDYVLDLFCGIGTVTDGLEAERYLGVDIHDPYLDAFHKKRPDFALINDDVLMFTAKNLLNTWEVILCIDGLEHMELDDALRVLAWIDTHATREILVFAPVGYSQNDPKDTWGIAGGDDYQRHRCGLDEPLFLDNGYKIVYSENPKNIYTGKRYKANMYHKSITRSPCPPRRGAS